MACRWATPSKETLWQALTEGNTLMNIVRSMNARKQETMCEETDADAASPYRVLSH